MDTRMDLYSSIVKTLVFFLPFIFFILFFISLMVYIHLKPDPYFNEVVSRKIKIIVCISKHCAWISVMLLLLSQVLMVFLHFYVGIFN